MSICLTVTMPIPLNYEVSSPWKMSFQLFKAESKQQLYHKKLNNFSWGITCSMLHKYNHKTMKSNVHKKRKWERYAKSRRFTMRNWPGLFRFDRTNPINRSRLTLNGFSTSWCSSSSSWANSPATPPMSSHRNGVWAYDPRIIVGRSHWQ